LPDDLASIIDAISLGESFPCNVDGPGNGDGSVDAVAVEKTKGSPARNKVKADDLA
jgi:hypothetical protein